MAAVVLSVISALASVISIASSRNCAGGLAALKDRVTNLETGGRGAPAATTGEDLAGEVAMLQKRLRSISATPPMEKVPPGSADSAGPFTELEAELHREQAVQKRAQAWVAATNQRVTTNFAKCLFLSAQQQSQVSQVLAPLLSNYWHAKKGSDAQAAAKAGDVLNAEAAIALKRLLTSEQLARFEELVSTSSDIFAAAAAASVPDGWKLDSKPAQK